MNTVETDQGVKRTKRKHAHERDTGSSHPLAYKPGDAAWKLGLSRATIYNMLADGRLASIKIGATTLIRHDKLQRLLDEAPPSPHTKFARAAGK